MEDNHKVSQMIEQEQSAPSLPKMRWYNFIIYVHLFACALTFLIMGIANLTTGNTQGNALFVTYNIIGVLMICFSIYGMIARQMLARFKRHAVVCLQVFYIGYVAILLLQLILDLSSGFTGAVIISFVALFICIEVFIVVFNHFYFGKRKFLFTGSPMTYTLLEIETEEQYRKEHPYIYGDYKGSDGWFAFLIYFLLFANAVELLAVGIFFIVLLCNGQINISAWVDNNFVSLSYAIIDYKLVIVFAIVILLLAAFMIITRFLLSSFKKAGVICLHCCFCINAAVATIQLIMTIIASVRVGENLVDFFTVVECVYCISVTIANFIYFKRRKDFFD